MITLYDKGQHLPLVWTRLIPATMEGQALFNVQNAMFAAGMAWAMGVKIEGIRHELRTFGHHLLPGPGRLNVYEEHPFKVIVDYGHNPHAIRAMCDLVQRLDVPGRRLAVLTIPGDRLRRGRRRVARISAPHFDHFVLRRDDNLRRRGPDEIPPAPQGPVGPACPRSGWPSSPTSRRPLSLRCGWRGRATCSSSSPRS